MAEQLEARGAGVTFQSICQDSYANALGEIIRRIRRSLAAACFRAR
ncbi:MAG: hypothetical protein M5U28_04280 [Sandaracinaceae bacterium]|nr:hypothetical protein [Sandaracinaceae bacterium]